MQYPDPRQGAECDFESARPVDAALKRILLHPTAQFALNFLYTGSIVEEQKRLRQHDQMLVAVQLPNPFVIAGAMNIEIGNHPKIRKAGAFVVDVIAPPFNIRSGCDLSGEQRELMAQDAAG